MSTIAVFGSTGSVGRQALEVVDAFEPDLTVTCLAAGSSIDALVEQACRYRPLRLVVARAADVDRVRAALDGTWKGEVLSGPEGLARAAAEPDTDVVLSAISGFAGLPVSLAAVESGRRLALANKESMVVAGPLLLETAARTGAEIVPVDSEHSALYQCLRAGSLEEVERLVITGSGGPFRERPMDTWDSITPEEAVRHPTWNMGPKISIDSATMMNKALEIVEAHHLFGMPAERLRVVVHPQSIVHGMVVFRDGSVIAHMGEPDMRVPIQYALTAPLRLPGPAARFDPVAAGSLTFEEPDLKRFPTISFGYEVVRRGGLTGAVLNGANERAVEHFLQRRIPFPAIFDLVGTTLAGFSDPGTRDLDAVASADRWAREEVDRCL